MRSTSAIEVSPSRTFCRPSSRSREHSFLERHRDHVVDRGVLEDHRADLLADGHHLVDAHTAAVARARAARAADGLVGLGARRGRARRGPHRRPSGGACSAGRASRTSRWATMQSTAEETRKGSMPMSISRPRALGASRVWSVERTRWPVRAASTAMCAVSRSRISPTMITSGSARSIERRPDVERDAGLGGDLHLLDAGDPLLDRVLDRQDAALAVVERRAAPRRASSTCPNPSGRSRARRRWAV